MAAGDDGLQARVCQRCCVASAVYTAIVHTLPTAAMLPGQCACVARAPAHNS